MYFSVFLYPGLYSAYINLDTVPFDFILMDAINHEISVLKHIDKKVQITCMESKDTIGID